MRKFAAVFASAGIAAAVAAAPVPAAASFNPLTQAYQEFLTASGCTTAGDCAIVFTALPSKTIVTHVSCDFFVATGGSLGYASLGGQNSNPHNNLQAYAFAAGSSGTNYGINAQVYLVYTKGQQPRVDVFLDGAAPVDLNCTISGYHA